MGRLQYIYNSATGPRILIENINSYTGWTRFEFKISFQNNPSVNPFYCNTPFFEGSMTLSSTTINFAGLSVPYVQDQIYTVSCGNGSKSINDTVASFTPSQRSDTFHMWLNANSGGRVLMHIYYMKFFDANDDVILDLEPYDDNGSIGIKDVNENVFFGNWVSASGSWIAGPAYRDDSNVVPINKYKLYTSNVQKTYNGSTQINKMYIGNDLVYRALPTTTGPQLVMPLDEVWYKTTNNTSETLKSGTYYIDANGNQLTYTESFDSESGLWKMKFNGNVYGNEGNIYYNYSNKLVELWLPYGYVRPKGLFIYGQNNFEKFKGDSPAIVDNGSSVVCLVQDNTNTKDWVIQTAKKGNTTITIPEGIVGVYVYCFYKTTATTVNLPSTITNIDSWSFEHSQITTMNCYATTCPTVASSAWLSVSNNGTLHYPTGSDYSSFTIPSSWTKVGDL